MRTYIIKVQNDYKDDVMGMLEDHGFDMQRDGGELSDISEVLIGVPGREKKRLAVYVSEFEITCSLARYIFLRITEKIFLKIPKDKIQYRRIK